MTKCLLLILLWLTAMDVASAQQKFADDRDVLALFDSKYRFEDFKVPVYKGMKAKLDLHGRTAHQFRTALRTGYNMLGANFAGHYTLVEWGCGSPCHSGAIIDNKNGKVYDIPGSGIGWDFKPESRMLIVNPPYFDSSNGRRYYIASRPYEWPEIYIFNETAKNFKLLKSWSDKTK